MTVGWAPPPPSRVAAVWPVAVCQHVCTHPPAENVLNVCYLPSTLPSLELQNQVRQWRERGNETEAGEGGEEELMGR